MSDTVGHKLFIYNAFEHIGETIIKILHFNNYHALVFRRNKMADVEEAPLFSVGFDVVNAIFKKI